MRKFSGVTVFCTENREIFAIGWGMFLVGLSFGLQLYFVLRDKVGMPSGLLAGLAALVGGAGAFISLPVYWTLWKKWASTGGNRTVEQERPSANDKSVQG